MKRDMDLVRRILIVVDENPSLSPVDLEFEGYSNVQIIYHLELLDDAGLVKGTYQEYVQGKAHRLSWDGHEFLCRIRDETRWNAIKAVAAARGEEISLALIDEVTEADAEGPPEPGATV
jgi:hypothetical protein